MTMIFENKNGSLEKVSWQHIKFQNRNVSFPEEVPEAIYQEYKYFPFAIAEPPSYDSNTQTIEEIDPVKKDNIYTQTWKIVEKFKTDTEKNKFLSDKAAAELVALAESNRNVRNDLLAATDYYGISDMTMTDAMKTYRKALRDLPTHKNWPSLKDEDWPTKPS